MARFAWIVVGQNKADGTWERVIWRRRQFSLYWIYEEDAEDYVVDHLDEILRRWTHCEIKRTIVFAQLKPKDIVLK